MAEPLSTDQFIAGEVSDPKLAKHFGNPLLLLHFLAYYAPLEGVAKLEAASKYLRSTQ